MRKKNSLRCFVDVCSDRLSRSHFLRLYFLDGINNKREIEIERTIRCSSQLAISVLIVAAGNTYDIVKLMDVVMEHRAVNRLHNADDFRKEAVERAILRDADATNTSSCPFHALNTDGFGDGLLISIEHGVYPPLGSFTNVGLMIVDA